MPDVRYMVFDGQLEGTGLRDYYEGGYIEPRSLGLSPDLVKKISDWVSNYQNTLLRQFYDEEEVRTLDKEGIELIHLIKEQYPERKINYYSAATKKLVII